jgi:hypothetical protein
LRSASPGPTSTARSRSNDEFAQSLGVDLESFPKFDKAVGDDVTFPVDKLDQRQRLDDIEDPDGGLEDYSGPYDPI